MRPMLVTAALSVVAFAAPTQAQTADQCDLVIVGDPDLITLEEPVLSVSGIRGRLTPPAIAGELAMVSSR